MPDVAQRESADRNDLLAIGGKLATLVAVLLPVAGFIIRYVAFSLNPATEASAEVLAWSVPISQLAATGGFSVVVALFVVAVAGLSDQIDRLPGPSHAHASLVAKGLLTISVAGLLVLPWSLALELAFGGAIGLGMGLWGRRLSRTDRRMTFAHGWWLAGPILLMAASACGLGANPDGITVANYTFAGSAHLRDGTFAQLGESGTTIYLQSCRQPSVVDAVNADEVLLRADITSSDRRSSPSLVSMILQHEPPDAGYRLPCP